MNKCRIFIEEKQAFPLDKYFTVRFRIFVFFVFSSVNIMDVREFKSYFLLLNELK